MCPPVCGSIPLVLMAQVASSGTSLLYGMGHSRAAGFPPKHSRSRLSAWPLSINVLSSRVLAHLGFAAGQHSTAQHSTHLSGTFPFPWHFPRFPSSGAAITSVRVEDTAGDTQQQSPVLPRALLGKVFGLFSGYVMAHGSLILAISPQPFTPCE